MIASVAEQIAAARRALVSAGLDAGDAALDAEVLARHLLGWDRAHLLTHRHLPAPDAFALSYQAAVSRRGQREPVALITGHREFWGLDFEVTGDVLVPRPETELIVEEAVARCRHRRPLRRIVDVGTGSGCIAIALALELPTARVVALDLSGKALAVAARNVRRHELTNRVQLLRGNLLDAIGGPVDLIVSNPPYVARRDGPSLPPEVLDYEPQAALFADEDGMAIIRVLSETAARTLTSDGLLIMEFGAGQEARLVTAAHASGWLAETVADLAGIARVAILSRTT